MSTIFPVQGYTEATAKCLDFQGFPKHYITNDGKVWSTLHDIWLAANTTDGRYVRYSFSNAGSHQSLLAHRLVAQAFVPNPENKPCVNHIDHNGFNNDSTNLEWCTPFENSQHMSLHGRGRGQERELAIRICESIVAGNRLSKIEELTGASPGQIRHIYHGNNYTNISKNYDFTEHKAEFCTPELGEEVLRRICQEIVNNPKMPAISIARSIPCSEGTVWDIVTRTAHVNISKDYDFSEREKYANDRKLSGALFHLANMADIAKAMTRSGKSAMELYEIIINPENSNVVANAFKRRNVKTILSRLRTHMTLEELDSLDNPT